MPELPYIVGLLRVQLVFESGVALAKNGQELFLVLHAIEVERVARVEDDDLLGEIAIIGIVQAVWGKN